MMPDSIDPTHASGYEFEKHVIGLFGREFNLLGWMQDGVRTRKEIEFCPDLILEHLPTGTVFGVECKFRSSLFGGNISWAKEYQPSKYQRYAEQTGHRVFVVIGIGGDPADPDYMYCLPLWKARHNMLDPSVLKRFRRNPCRKFVYDRTSGELK